MSGKRRRDYLAVLWALKQEFRRRDLSWNLECVTMDFEAAAWAAFRAAFPEVDVVDAPSIGGKQYGVTCRSWGCNMPTKTTQHSTVIADSSWHCRTFLGRRWTAIWQSWKGRLQQKGSAACAPTYTRHGLSQQFGHLPNWSCFYRSIRTNNDVEGWHRRLNSKASSAGNLNLYLMLQLLAEEPRLVTRGCQLLKESTIIRRQRADARSTNAKLFRIWDRLVTRERTARQVLRAVSHLVPF
ncbi:hypothetical protein ACOMHN_065922 [Nucella lapillus]